MPSLKNEIDNFVIKFGDLIYKGESDETLAAIEFEEGEEYPYVVYNYKVNGTEKFITGYKTLGDAINNVLKIK